MSDSWQLDQTRLNFSNYSFKNLRPLPIKALMIQRNSNQDQALHEAIMAELSRRIPEQNYLTWFRNVRFVRIDSQRIGILSHNNFTATYLQHRFQENILESIEAVTGLTNAQIEFRLQNNPLEDDSYETHERSVPQANNRQQLKTPTTPAEARAYSSKIPEMIPLNADYTFDQFITGPANRLAHAASISVANNPGTSYNPLFIHGSVGLGKTHLMQAVAHTLITSGMQRIVYLSCASFTNDFISAVEKNDLETFRKKYREADALLIDDIQFLANKERTQEEFFHTFNTVYNLQRQIFLSSDCIPSEISGLGDRLISRFKLGLVAQLSPPSFETRVAILLRKGRNIGLEIPQDVGELLGQRLRDNVRELEGAVYRLQSLVTIEKRIMTIENVRDSLADLLGEQDHKINLTMIEQLVLEHFDVKSSDLHSKRRSRSIVIPRQICMFLARKLTELSLGEIGNYFAGRDHSTVLHSVDKIESQIRSDAKVRQIIQSLEQRLSR